MGKFLMRWFVSALSIYITAKLFQNLYISDFGTAMIAAVILGGANMFMKPIIFLFTLPINVLTLGLFTFVVNGIVLKLAAVFVPGFTVNGFFGAILASIVLSIVHMILSGVFGLKKD
ncbi:MAG: phage holin family protein [Thermotaleaceae bacterium]